jgi:hypothetical protein
LHGVLEAPTPLAATQNTPAALVTQGPVRPELVVWRMEKGGPNGVTGGGQVQCKRPS